MTEREQLEAAVAMSPEDDTVRLAMADWLEEQGNKERPCTNEECRHGQVYEMRECRDGIWRNAWGECPLCKGNGSILDTRDNDRAEFIRKSIQVALLKRDNHGDVCTRVRDFYASPESKKPGGQAIMQCRGCEELVFLEHEARELENLNLEWKSLKCPECDGDGSHERQHGTTVDCVCCGGTGDLLRKMVVGGPNDDEDLVGPRNPQFTRGFIDSVECEMAEIGVEGVFDYPNKEGDVFQRPIFLPSPWATAIVKALPVTRFVDPSRRPLQRNDGKWWISCSVHIDVDSTAIPWSCESTMEELYPRSPGHQLWLFDTEDAAKDAVALMFGKLVRNNSK